MNQIFKNKGFVIALILAVVGIWGGIVYRIVDYSRKEVPIQEIKRQERTVVTDSVRLLLLNYRDPFLGVIRKQEKAVIKVHEEKPPTLMEQSPSFRYAGKIKQGKEYYLLIRTSTEIKVVNVCEKRIEGFKIEKIYDDSLCVSKGRSRYILRLE